MNPGAPPAAPPGLVPARGSRGWWAGWVPVPTRRTVWVLLAAAATVLVVPLPGTAALLGVLVLLAVDAWRAPAPWRVEVRRDLPAVVPLGSDAEVVWRVRNPGARSLAVELADELAPSLGARERRVAAVVPPHGVVHLRTSLRPRRRGTFRPRSLTVRVAGPLRLATRQAPRVLPGELQVHPSFRSRRQADLRLRRARLLTEGQRATARRGGGTEFDSLREYVQGDEYRSIDWAATARAGRPIVRTLRAERNQQVLVLLDAGRVVAGSVDAVPRLDHGMDATLALATVATRLGDRVGLVAFGAAPRAIVPPRRGADQLRRLSRAMHALEPELAESGYREAFRVTLARFHRRALLVLVTELASEAVQETLVPALPLVLRDHAVLVASVRDPQLEAWRDGGAGSPQVAYRSAAAAGVLADRERTAGLLRGLGVVVVDAPPGELAGRLSDTYVDLKFGGRL